MRVDFSVIVRNTSVHCPLVVIMRHCNIKICQASVNADVKQC